MNISKNHVRLTKAEQRALDKANDIVECIRSVAAHCDSLETVRRAMGDDGLIARNGGVAAKGAIDQCETHK